MIKRFILAAAALGAAALLALPLAQTAQAAPREAAPTAFDPVVPARIQGLLLLRRFLLTHRLLFI